MLYTLCSGVWGHVHCTAGHRCYILCAVGSGVTSTVQQATGAIYSVQWGLGSSPLYSRPQVLYTLCCGESPIVSLCTLSSLFPLHVLAPGETGGAEQAGVPGHSGQQWWEEGGER